MPSRRPVDAQGKPWNCANCGDLTDWHTRGANDRCAPCSHHLWLHGVERPARRIALARGRKQAEDAGLVWCPTCLTGKQPEAFAKGPSPHGLQHDCRQCQSERRGVQEQKRRDRYYADPEFRARRLEHHSRARNTRRARKHGVETETFGMDYIYERDSGICQLCNRKVKRGDAHMDHIIPFALGGAHVRPNVHLAHASCNQRKWIHPANEQLLLIG
jgi:5-methylcytosine-specific restriction endonuclease McrA